MSKVQIVRLSTGEEIVAKATENDDSYTLKSPAILIPAGRDQLAFGQWLPYADIENGIEINKKYIVFVVEPMTELANQYSSSFGSGIVVPEKGPVAGASLKLST